MADHKRPKRVNSFRAVAAMRRIRDEADQRARGHLRHLAQIGRQDERFRQTLEEWRQAVAEREECQRKLLSGEPL